MRLSPVKMILTSAEKKARKPSSVMPLYLKIKEIKRYSKFSSICSKFKSTLKVAVYFSYMKK